MGAAKRQSIDPAALATASVAAIVSVMVAEGPFNILSWPISATILLILFAHDATPTRSRYESLHVAAVSAFAGMLIFAFPMELAFTICKGAPTKRCLVGCDAPLPYVGTVCVNASEPDNLDSAVPTVALFGAWLFSLAVVFAIDRFRVRRYRRRAAPATAAQGAAARDTEKRLRINSEEVPLELRVAAFTALREEISRRSNAQLTLVGLSLAAFTAIATVVVSSEPKQYELLLLVPFVSGFAGLTWLDHHTRIAQIGAYILRQVFEGRPGSFEEDSRERARDERLMRFLGFVAPTWGVFAGPAIAAIYWAYTRDNQVTKSSLWYPAACITVGYGAVLLFTLLRGQNRDRNSKKSA